MNVEDRKLKGRHARHYRHLTRAETKKIRKLRDEGVTITTLAKQFSVHYQTIVRHARV